MKMEKPLSGRGRLCLDEPTHSLVHWRTGFGQDEDLEKRSARLLQRTYAKRFGPMIFLSLIDKYLAECQGFEKLGTIMTGWMHGSYHLSLV